MDAPTAVMLVLLVVLIFFIFRSRRKRQRDQANLQEKMAPGVEVMLTFGIYGRLVSIDDAENVAEVEIAPGTIIKVHRQTLGRVIEPVSADQVSADQVSTNQAAATTPASDYDSVADGTTPRYSLDKDDAIDSDSSEAPEFGERIDTTKSSSRDIDKDGN